MSYLQVEGFLEAEDKLRIKIYEAGMAFCL